MFDLSQMGMPAIADAHGKKWLAVYRIRGDSAGTLFIAAEADANGQVLLSALPLPLSLILVPHDEETAALYKKMEDADAKKAEKKPGE